MSNTKTYVPPVLKFFDFWLSDFSWYRKLTKGKYEWYRASSLMEIWWIRDDEHLFEKLKTIEEQLNK